MVIITESEKAAICSKYPETHIVRTMKQDSKRHHYYMVEDNAPMKLLKSLRGQGENHGGRKRKKPHG